MKKIYLILSLLIITGITFAQEARRNYAPVEKMNKISATSSNKEVSADIACDAGSLFGNDYASLSAATPSDIGVVAATDFATIGGTIETLKLWGITFSHDGTTYVSCDESNPLTVDINFYADVAALEAGTPTQFFDDVTASATATAETFSQFEFPVYEWNITLPSAVSLSSGIIAINADTVGTANAADCWFSWINTEAGYGNSYFYDGTSWSTDGTVQYTICMGGTASTCLIPSELTASNITNVSADIAWTENGTAATWEYEVVEAGTTPTGTGTSVTATTVSLASLTAGTAYEIYVRTDCGSGLYSDWSAPYSFMTAACAPADQCDYEFVLTDAYGDGWGDASISVVQGGVEVAQVAPVTAGPANTPTTETITVTICTDMAVEFIMNGLGDTYDYEISFAINSPFGIELISVADGSTLTNGTAFHSFTSSCTAPVEPIATLSATEWDAGTIEVNSNITSFDFTLTNTQVSTLTVTSVSDLTATDFATTFAEGDVSLAAGEAYTFTFTYNAPAAIGTSNATFSIVTNGGTVGVALSGEAIAECASSITLFPYSEDFEAMTNNVVCWESLYNTAADGGLNGANLVSQSGWIVTDNADYIHGGERAAYISWAAADFNWLVSNDIVLPETGSYDLSFWTFFAQMPTLNYISKLHVMVYADDVWNTEQSWTDGTYDNQNAEEVFISLAAYANKTIKIAFVHEFNDGVEMAIDDISIKLGTTGVDVIDNNSVSLYPNPTTGIVNIANAENNTVVVYNMIGQVVISVENTQSIDMSAFENGTYIVKVVSENETITKKINLIK